MEQSIQLFQFNDQAVRAIEANGEPWLVASDVCKILGIANVSQATQDLDEDEKLLYTLHISGQNRNVLLVSEAGLYGLIFVSRKPAAKDFKRWVKHEVLPAIRKTGRYEASGPKHTLSSMLAQRANINKTRVPDHYFSVMSALFGQLYGLEILAKDLDSDASIEISVGKRWPIYARDVLGVPESDMCRYTHVLANGNTTEARAYSHKWLTSFEKWLWGIYFPEKFPAYLAYRTKYLGFPSMAGSKQVLPPAR